MSVGLEGMRGHKIIVEANVRVEKEACIIIGLSDASMKESKERILNCLHTLEFDVSMKKITIQLSPAGLSISNLLDSNTVSYENNCLNCVGTWYRRLQHTRPE